MQADTAPVVNQGPTQRVKRQKSKRLSRPKSTSPMPTDGDSGIRAAEGTVDSDDEFQEFFDADHVKDMERHLGSDDGSYFDAIHADVAAESSDDDDDDSDLLLVHDISLESHTAIASAVVGHAGSTNDDVVEAVVSSLNDVIEPSWDEPDEKEMARKVDGGIYEELQLDEDELMAAMAEQDLTEEPTQDNEEEDNESLVDSDNDQVFAEREEVTDADGPRGVQDGSAASGGNEDESSGAELVQVVDADDAFERVESLGEKASVLALQTHVVDDGAGDAPPLMDNEGQPETVASSSNVQPSLSFAVDKEQRDEETTLQRDHVEKHDDSELVVDVVVDVMQVAAQVAIVDDHGQDRDQTTHERTTAAQNMETYEMSDDDVNIPCDTVPPPSQRDTIIPTLDQVPNSTLDDHVIDDRPITLSVDDVDKDDDKVDDVIMKTPSDDVSPDAIDDTVLPTTTIQQFVPPTGAVGRDDDVITLPPAPPVSVSINRADSAGSDGRCTLLEPSTDEEDASGLATPFEPSASPTTAARRLSTNPFDDHPPGTLADESEAGAAAVITLPPSFSTPLQDSNGDEAASTLCVTSPVDTPPPVVFNPSDWHDDDDDSDSDEEVAVPPPLGLQTKGRRRGDEADWSDDDELEVDSALALTISAPDVVAYAAVAPSSNPLADALSAAMAESVTSSSVLPVPRHDSLQLDQMSFGISYQKTKTKPPQIMSTVNSVADDDMLLSIHSARDSRDDDDEFGDVMRTDDVELDKLTNARLAKEAANETAMLAQVQLATRLERLALEQAATSSRTTEDMVGIDHLTTDKTVLAELHDMYKRGLGDQEVVALASNESATTTTLPVNVHITQAIAEEDEADENTKSIYPDQPTPPLPSEDEAAAAWKSVEAFQHEKAAARKPHEPFRWIHFKEAHVHFRDADYVRRHEDAIVVEDADAAAPSGCLSCFRPPTLSFPSALEQRDLVRVAIYGENIYLYENIYMKN
ncbi:hypothetical protein, variant 2 [Aphanomyces astaci]|uniref:Uncharacterized protein n=1 Tax=Aphanomyces astaci TaxID=112090 RepID=W4FTZ3_APHAT|nr:hypothetical protein, variant 2 [Aphanomyces astaci]ETV70431.1 hypothetical protein, variant 2 [Aphanomyces astaci]|eukprot:XP_009840145.1 hypothetical protein, variant 2 [Aphanomyces astaci]